MALRRMQGAPLFGLAIALACAESPAPDAPAQKKELSKESLTQMARAGGDWILRMQHDSGENRGRFLYEFDPAKGQPSRDFQTDNFLRQAGTAYSLILVYEATHREEYLKGAERAVEYLLSRLVQDPAAPDRSYFEFQGQVKLGGAALPLLSLMKLKQIQKTDRYDEAMVRITRFLVSMQQADGELRSIHLYAGSPDHPKIHWDSAIYPGEAMLALTRRYALTRDEQLLQVLDKAFEFYRTRKDRYLRQAFIPWTTTAMVELYDLTGQERFAEWAIEMTDFLLQTQILDPAAAAFGSFRPSPSANTGTYLEGILDAYRLVASKNDVERRARYRSSAFAGFRFLKGLQYDAATAERYPQVKPLLVGGFRGGPDDTAVRIDHTQHAVSAIVKGAAYL